MAAVWVWYRHRTGECRIPRCEKDRSSSHLHLHLCLRTRRPVPRRYLPIWEEYSVQPVIVMLLLSISISLTKRANVVLRRSIRFHLLGKEGTIWRHRTDASLFLGLTPGGGLASTPTRAVAAAAARLAILRRARRWRII